MVVRVKYTYCWIYVRQNLLQNNVVRWIYAYAPQKMTIEAALIINI